MSISATPAAHDAHVVIVGAGQAGATAAATLRQRGHRGRITMLGDEAVTPYQRPLLSKAYLKGDLPLDRLLMRPAAFWSDQSIEMRTGAKVTSIDTAGRCVVVDGGPLHYDLLILATGVSPRPLPQLPAGARNVMRLHTVEDSDRLRTALEKDSRLVIVGAGYVGLEVAASARARGAQVTVLEREPRVLARVASGSLSSWVAAKHRANGVDIRLNARIEQFRTESDRIRAVVLDDGSKIACDALLVGIGSVPNDGLARDAGIQCAAAGIEVDNACRTSAHGVYAIGDVTCRPVLGGYQPLMRLESIQSANEQARLMVEAVLGNAAPDLEVPWFWSDQYDAKIQIAGLVRPNDTVVVRESAGGRGVAYFHMRGMVVVAIEAVNAAPEFMVAKQLIKSQRAVDPMALADPALPMKTFTNV
jgi:3-phenylpropionate/trans-cinnamate dioxygenase ferredoxin reductase subunit